MSLVCCLDPEPGCKCEKAKVCGGVHIINQMCEVHTRRELTSSIHEAGEKRIEVVEGV